MTMIDITPRDALEKTGFLDRMPDVKLPKAPPMRVRRLTMWLFFLGFGVFGGLLTWACFAQITSAVITSGTFRVVDERLVVQHLEGGILRKINVREGDVVQEGQILAEIDGTRSKSQRGILRSQMVSALSQEVRLQAELDDAQDLEMTPQLRALLAEDPRLNKLFEAQRSIFRSNAEMIDGQIVLFNERKLQLAEQINGLNARRNSFQEQLSLIQEEIINLKALYEKGLVTATRMSALRQNESGILGNLGGLDSSLANIEQRIAEVDERILQLRRDRLNTVSQALSRAQEAVFDVQERIDTVSDIERREYIRAPRSGQIVGLAVNTIGGVLSPGQTVLEIVPHDAALVVETKVKPTDIDEVFLDGKAQVRLTAYNTRTTLPVTGRVVHISADSMVDEDNGSNYFRVDVEVTPEELEALGDGQIKAQPGMPAQVMIETGEQTVMDYILGPVMANFETAMKEGS
jgi:epimerase transport system membrane fusion protein